MKTAVVVVDASVWVSRLISSDVNHDASHRWMEQYNIAKGRQVSPAILLIEVAAAISRQTGHPELAKEAVKTMNKVSTLRLIPLDKSIVQLSIDMAVELQLRAADAVYVAVAHHLNIPLVSWDKEQLHRASRLIKTYTPNTYL